MKFKNLLCSVFVIFTITNSALAIEEELILRPVDIKDGSIVSIIDCVSAAYKNSPKIKRQKYNLDIATSKVGIA